VASRDELATWVARLDEIGIEDAKFGGRRS
jgi:hypothetical protein